MSGTRRLILLSLGLWALAMLARGPAVGNEYLNFDDQNFITDQPAVQEGLTLRGLKTAFAAPAPAYYWAPLTFISFMIDLRLFGPGPLGPHLTNILLNSANVVLLFLLLALATGAAWRAAGAAALLAVHPIHTESVVWACERKDVLSLFFGLLSLLAYVRYVYLPPGRTGTQPQANFAGLLPLGGARGRMYLLACALAAAAMMAKPMLVTLPCIMLLLDYWPLRRLRAGGGSGAWAWVILDKIPFLAFAGAAAVITLIAQRPVMPTLAAIPLNIRLVNVPVAYGWYLYRLVWPTELPPCYTYRLVWPAWAVVAAPVLLAGVSIFVFLARRSRPWLLVGWLWYLGTLVPVIGLTQSGWQAVACRFVYLPFIGLYIALAWSLPVLTTAGARLAAGIAAGILLAVLVVMSIIQDHHWKNNETLFTYAMATSPDSALPHATLGDTLHQRGDLRGALKQYTRAVLLDSANIEYLTALAQTDLELGRLSAADSILRIAEARQAGAPAVLATRGMLRFMRGQPEAAAVLLRQAVAEAPSKALYRHQLAVALAQSGRLGEALDANAAAVALDPGNAMFWDNYSRALSDAGRPDEALAAAAEAVKLKPDWAEAHNRLGVCLARENRITDAAGQFQRALELRPDFPEAKANLARAQARLRGKPASAPGGGR